MPFSRDTISLAGEWRFSLDRENEGIQKKWFEQKLADTITLPGTTDEAQKGDFVDEQCDNRLSRQWRWIGPAWYQKSLSIPEDWRDKRIMLRLERTKDTQVWVDDIWIGSEDSLSTSHTFDLSEQLSPGSHTLTILVDNAKLPPVGPCHAVDERTQTNWNGIVGNIELTASEKIWIDTIQVYPDVSRKTVRVAAIILNETAWTGHIDVNMRLEQVNTGDIIAISPPLQIARTEGPETTFDVELELPDNAPLWDEFARPMFLLTLELKSQPRAEDIYDTYSIMFGLRNFITRNGQFVINGRPVFLRGKHDAALFPLTGYAPMEKAEWLRLLGISADHGMNHYRFHSWCPPRAAFEAADELGIYFQIELPNKREITEPDNHSYSPPSEAYETLDELTGDAGEPAVRTAYLIREGEKILNEFGNHPSFVMMTLGNELGGDESVMRSMCDHFRAIDSRHLYAMGTGHFHWDTRYREGDDFWVTCETSLGRPTRGASFGAKTPCHVDNAPPSTMVDYSASLAGVPVPVVGHEMAQYEVYPDFTEIEKYTGVVRARNLEIFRERLDAAGMLDQADDFFRASGGLSAICHREDVEAALRTPGFGGFQMLDLQDFSGQGTALVGMLNVFMESKGLITPHKWREFCCETVPLLWMTKYTWTNDETFNARIRLAHYGPSDLQDQLVSWSVSDGGSREIAGGSTRRMHMRTGTVSDVDLFSVSLAEIKKPHKLEIILEVDGTGFRNTYPIWVYPAKINTKPPAGIKVVRSFTASVQADLAGGASILLIPEPGKIKQSIRGAFQTSFWCWPMFRTTALKAGIEVAPGTNGFLCDPDHQVFKDFPTEFHGNWQWWHLLKNGRPLILDSTPTEYRPVLQMIDNFARNHKLGLICEAKVGKGKLLICSIDLPFLQDKPEARQLLASLQQYVAGGDF
ncbi:MAG: beta-galactosidase, partial [Spirochaetales bacterium]|nr:beta-galactosidase [Spirochaetales bacterium]